MPRMLGKAPVNPRRDRPRGRLWRRLRAWAAGALALSAFVLGASMVQSLAWQPTNIWGRGWIEPVTNLLHAMNAPGWGVTLATIGLPSRYPFSLLLMVTLISCVCYTVGIGAAFWGARTIQRRRLVRPRATKTENATPEPDPTRRRLAFGGIAVVCAAPAVGLMYSTLAEPFDLRVRRYRVPIRGLGAAWHGLRVVQLTDTHLGPRVPAWHIRAAVERAIALRPGLVVLTGDYVHQGGARIGEAGELLAPLASAGLPVAGVLGNHDHYSGNPRAVRRAMERAGVRMLDNTRTFLHPGGRLSPEPGRESGAICLAGVGDLETDRVDLARALGGVSPETPRLLLSHNPDVAEHRNLTAPGSARVDLMLSGHTHGGHIALPLLGRPGVRSRYGQKYAHGLVPGPACPVVISAGVGMSILPVRFGVPPEVVLVELVPG